MTGPLEIPDLLRQMERNDGHFARAAVTEALARREEIVPELLGILEAVADDPQRYAKDPDYMALTYAMFLLARFRETRAYPLLVRIFSAPGETPFDLVGDTVTENLCNILASVSGGDVRGMTALIENEQANEYVRSAAMKGLLTLVVAGQRTRDEVMEYFASLFGKLERTPNHAWSALASCCTRLGPGEVLEQIQRAYEDELIEPFMIQWSDVEEAAGLSSEEVIERLRRQRFHLITDVVKEMEWWACFKKQPRPKGSRAPSSPRFRVGPRLPSRLPIRPGHRYRSGEPSPKWAGTTPAPAAAARSTRGAAGGDGQAGGGGPAFARVHSITSSPSARAASARSRASGSSSTARDFPRRWHLAVTALAASHSRPLSVSALNR